MMGPMTAAPRQRLKPVLSRLFSVLAIVAVWAPFAQAQDSPASAPAAESSPTASTRAPEDYMRVARPDTNTIQLQIALRQFKPAQGSGPALWLAAVSHIGETNYYDHLQTFLNAQPLVLFEGVGYDEAKGQFGKRRDRARPGATEEEETPAASETSSLQSTLAQSLGLAFQLDAIDYDRPNFRNSDMSISQLQTFLTKRLQDQDDDDKDSGGGANAEFLALLQAMDGSSWLGAVMHMGVKLLGSSPKLQAMSRLMMIEVLGELKGDLSQVQGLPPSMQKLIRVLIQTRNDVVIRDLKAALSRKKPPASIAVFYGAAHMNDMEKRLLKELDYQRAGEKWMPAITVRPAKAGLTASEIEMIRGLIRWQMKALGNNPTPAP
jgi:hypothetical protein